MKDMGKAMKFLMALSLGAGLIWTQAAIGAEAPKKAAPPVVKPAAPKPRPAATKAAPRRVEIKITDEGYVPSPIKLKKDEPVVLAVTRTTDETCALDLVMPQYAINKPLPLNEQVEIAFTPNKTGSLKYGCAMDQMISGTFVVE